MAGPWSKKKPSEFWKFRNRKTGHYSHGGIDAEFDSTGRAFKNKIGAKGSLFHYVYGFNIDPDGVRRFHPRPGRSIDGFELVRFVDGTENEVIPGRRAFTPNQLLNKEDRDLDGLSAAELAAENRKQF